MTRESSLNVRFWLIVAAVNGAIAVAMGAYGAHVLDASPKYQVQSFNTGVQYHMWHTLALIGISWISVHTSNSLLTVLSGIGFCLGIILFCGTLYIIGLTGDPPFRGLAPIGGGSMVISWIFLALAAWRA